MCYDTEHMKKTTRVTKIIGGVIIVLVIGIPMTIWWKDRNTPGKLDGFAQCIADSSAKFYGAFWCPHCQAQKALFGKSVKLLPYIECSASNDKGQLQVCIDKKITGYPTWEFSDGSRLSGEISLATLAEKTNCTLPSGS